MNQKIINRCTWCGTDPLYVEYHDTEWGVPVYDDTKLFEFLILEGAQAGLSWLTILKRREGYRRVFANFDFEKVANFSDAKLKQALLDPGIIRNRLKVAATQKNARAFLEVRKEFGTFSKYQWDFVGHKPITNKILTLKDIPAKTTISDTWSRDMKKRGFTFVGSTILYAHMQAVGMVNDHLQTCFRFNEIKKISPSS